jgi:catechol 2,3-dioxygenase-like lactoylglutathione lyase family enzyme
MQPRVTVITLGVADLDRALRFYRDGLGLATPGIVGAQFEHGAVVFIELAGGVALALWPRESLAHDVGLAVSTPASPGFSLGHNVNSRDDVEAVMRQAADAGARIVRPAHETFWGGYSGYFQDPDGHLWEVVWNPQRPVA